MGNEEFEMSEYFGRTVRISKQGSFSTDGNNNLEFTESSDGKTAFLGSSGREKIAIEAAVFEKFWAALAEIKYVNVIKESAGVLMLDGTSYEILIKSAACSISLRLINPGFHGEPETVKLMEIINSMLSFGESKGFTDRYGTFEKKDLMVIKK